MHEEHDKGGGVSAVVWANVEILLASTELRRRTCNMGPADRHPPLCLCKIMSELANISKLVFERRLYC